MKHIRTYESLLTDEEFKEKNKKFFEEKTEQYILYGRSNYDSDNDFVRGEDGNYSELHKIKVGDLNDVLTHYKFQLDNMKSGSPVYVKLFIVKSETKRELMSDKEIHFLLNTKKYNL